MSLNIGILPGKASAKLKEFASEQPQCGSDATGKKSQGKENLAFPGARDFQMAR
jgi:hypothetical protein